MGWFDSKEEKRDRQMQEFKDRYNLNNISKEDMEVLTRISQDMFTNKLFKAGMALSFARAEEQAKVGYLNTLVEQNWMIIRKLDEISQKLDK